MDLRKYSRKIINPERVIHYEYIYHSIWNAANKTARLIIVIDKIVDDPYSETDLSITLNEQGRIKSVERYRNRCISCKFPANIEEKAEQILIDITTINHGIAPDFSLLKDNYCPPNVHDIVAPEPDYNEILGKWLMGEDYYLTSVLMALDKANVEYTSDLLYLVLRRIRQYEENLDNWAFCAGIICPGLLSITKGYRTDRRIKEELLHIEQIMETIASHRSEILPVNPYFINGGEIRLAEALKKALDD